MPAPPASIRRWRSQQGMVGIYAAVSTLNHMAPWGGAEALMGTNPIAIAIPAGKEAPVRARHRHLGILVRQYPAASRPRRAAAGGLGGAQQDRRADHRSEEGRRGRAAADRRPQGQRACADDRAARRRAQRRGVRPRGCRSVGARQRSRPTPGSSSIALDVSRFIAPEVFAAEMDRHLKDLRLVADLAGLRFRSGCRARIAASAAPTAAPTACNCRRRWSSNSTVWRRA